MTRVTTQSLFNMEVSEELNILYGSWQQPEQVSQRTSFRWMTFSDLGFKVNVVSLPPHSIDFKRESWPLQVQGEGIQLLLLMQSN